MPVDPRAELEDAIDELDLIKEDLSTREKPVEAWGSADGSSSKAVATESVPAPAEQKSHKAPTGGSGSYDSTMTNFEAEARAARAISRHARAITTRVCLLPCFQVSLAARIARVGRRWRCPTL